MASDGNELLMLVLAMQARTPGPRGPAGPQGPSGADAVAPTLPDVAFVAANGVDAPGRGSFSAPFATPAYAVSQVMPAPTSLTEFERQRVVVILTPGVYGTRVVVPTGKLTIWAWADGVEIPDGIEWNLHGAEKFTSSQLPMLRVASTSRVAGSLQVGSAGVHFNVNDPDADIGDVALFLEGVWTMDSGLYFTSTVTGKWECSDVRFEATVRSQGVVGTARNVYFAGPVTVDHFDEVTNCTFMDDVIGPVDGATYLVGCKFNPVAQSWRGPGGTFLRLDAASNAMFMVGPWVLGSGIAKSVIHSLV